MAEGPTGNEARAAMVARAAALLVLWGCSTAPRVDDFVVRLDATGAFALQPEGIVRAREDEDEGGLEGDRVRLQRDLKTDAGPGWAVSADVRPVLNHEIRFDYRQAGDLEGDAFLERTRRFDGRTYGGETLQSTLQWESWRLSAAHRVLALGNPTGPSGPLADVLVRAGAEQSTFDVEIEGGATPEESRQTRTGAPFIALEGRARVMPRAVFEHALSYGYWNHHGVRHHGLDAAAGFRVRVAGPLSALLRYELLLRDSRARFGDGELSRVEAQLHVFSAGLALEF